jgi:hypothetical protein
LKKYKSPGSDHIPAELIKAGGEKLLSAIHKPINYIFTIKEELLEEWKKSNICPITKEVIKLSVIIIAGHHCYQRDAKCYRMSFFQGEIHTWM